MASSIGLDEAAEIVRLDIVESTNNYAMAALDADRAGHGFAVVAARQSAGRGQRGHGWFSGEGESLLMSVVLRPGWGLTEQARFSAAVSVAVAGVFASLHTQSALRIKWPNDLILGDKKAGGILIENVIRGVEWCWAVVGIGINVLQKSFPDTLPNATSLAIAGSAAVSVEHLAQRIREALLAIAPASDPLLSFNDLLYRRDEFQEFSQDGARFSARILDMMPTGELRLLHTDGTIRAHRHGSLEWIWPASAPTP